MRAAGLAFETFVSKFLVPTADARLGRRRRGGVRGSSRRRVVGKTASTWSAAATLASIVVVPASVVVAKTIVSDKIHLGLFVAVGVGEVRG